MPDFSIKGKFIFSGDDKFYIRGVTYGTFRADENGILFPARNTVERDFEMISRAGINTVRVYTVPPVWLLDCAASHGLCVMVGLPWEQHIAFLDERGNAATIETRLRQAVRELGAHRAILCYVVGNEIPASIVRWYGARKIERFIRRLYRAVKEEAPGMLATYVNYPTTEYLHLPFLDFLCFNVYLERQRELEAYLAELQNAAGDRPLVMAEVGLDSRRNGEALQAKTLEWQIRTIFATGCAGAIVFSWTDDWCRGGQDIEDWDFGLVTRNRSPKAALAAVRSAFHGVPFAKSIEWPRISVVVCTHNGARTLRQCLEGLMQLEYPNCEVIVVDDGSSDQSASIAREFPFLTISVPHGGLGAARNTGMETATGEIIAYIDDDAWPDPHWLHYLAWTFMHSDYAAVGGPNIPPAEDGPIAECVANAPGGPVHVLVSHRVAEHIPGCNCSFRRDRLMAIGGFDTRFWSAGDDVDVCWRLLEQGWEIGFHAGAMVWHHRRPSLRTYWKQQRGYGRAEALLEEKWPSKYNTFGHIAWSGRLYGRGLTRIFQPQRVYHGVWGGAPFQRLYSPGPSTLAALTTAPEWYFIVLALLMVLLLSHYWSPLRLAAFPLSLAVFIPVLHIIRSVAGAPFVHDKLRYRMTTGVLYMLQPLARLWGRFANRPALRRRDTPWSAPRTQILRVWSEQWKAPEEWLAAVESALRKDGIAVWRGGDFEPWDLETRPGLSGTARLKMAVEEHGSGKQLLLFQLRPRIARGALALSAVLGLLSAEALFHERLLPSYIFFAGFSLVVCRIVKDCGTALSGALGGVQSLTDTLPAENQSVLRNLKVPNAAQGDQRYPNG